MSSERDFASLPHDMQQFLVELQRKERIRDLQSQFWTLMDGLSKRELDLLQRAYRIGLADGLQEPSTPAGTEWRQLVLDKTLQAMLKEYAALDRALDRLIGLIGKMLQDHDPASMKPYRNRLNDILNELVGNIADSRKDV